jgi:hypothetical protein
MKTRSATGSSLSSHLLAAGCLASLLLGAGTAHGDEGMWLMNKAPIATIKNTYGFEITPEWLTAMQKSAVRFETGGSGSIVSKDGLVMTNHHVGSDMLLKLSTKENDLIKNGFYAKTRESEIKCPDLVIDILWEIEDVTARVMEAATKVEDEAGKGAARRRAISAIQGESKEKTGLKSEVVTLYQGGQYHLYRYKSFTDVRLVFAPQESAAFFGGDADNFEFPRFNLDCAFFRLYEGGKPYQPEHYLRWSQSGAAENELTFVFGHPGRTRRLYTADHLRFLRDIELPSRLAGLWRSEVSYQGFAGRSAENARIANDRVRGVSNSRKAFTGLLAGLQDPAMIARKEKQEGELRSKVENNEELSEKYGDAWQTISQLQEIHAEIYEQRIAVNRLVAGSNLLSKAMTIVRLSQELPKKNEERLPEYNDSGLEELYFQLYSPEPVHDALEAFDLALQLSNLAEKFGGEDPFVVELLAGKSPRARAAELVAGCTFKDPAQRKKLVEGGEAAVKAANDPLLSLAQMIDPEQRALRTQYEDDVESVERSNYAKVAAASFAILGESVYPDATFTLRLSYGTVKGLPGIAPFTDIGGTYARATERNNTGEFVLPQNWWDSKGKLTLSTPYNFICTADIIGGNSGSPVVNSKGEVVGLIFDGNIDSLVGDVVYDINTNRAVAVDSRGMIELMGKVYNATELVTELTGK